jgi:small subunit ribosomal protein S18
LLLAKIYLRDISQVASNRYAGAQAALKSLTVHSHGWKKERRMKPTKTRSRDMSDGGPRKRKLDPVVANKIDFIDYKDVNLLRKFITENGKVLPRRITGCNAKNQRSITLAIKRARALGMLPFTGSI